MTRFEEILRGKGESLVPMLHLTQMNTFIEGAGIEFYPLTDLQDIRKNFIDDLVESNQLANEVSGMASQMMLTGSILVWLRPDGRNYDIRYFPKEQYRIYFNDDAKMESVEIIYSYFKRSQQTLGMQQQTYTGGLSAGNEHWIRIRLTSKTYERWDYGATKPTFDETQLTKVADSVAQNTLGYIPCVECQNVNYRGERGVGEFEELRGQIEAHNSQAEAIKQNLLGCSNNVFITSLDEDQIFEAIGAEAKTNSVAYASGFRTAEQTAEERGFNTSKEGKRIKMVIGGFNPGAGDFFQQVVVQPLPPNHLGFVDDKERKLRAALGGTDERGLETASETRIVFGKAYVTAAKKQRSLFTYGLCEIISMAILTEENLFLASEGKIGLATAAFSLDRKIKWRQQPAFPKSSSERLNEDIIGRNMARKGVNPLDVLRNTFSDKSDIELKQMLAGGLPIEYLEMLARTASILQGVFDPATGLPMTSVIPMTQYLQNALQYAGQPGTGYINTGTAGATVELEHESLAAARRVAERLGLRPTEPTTDPATGITTSSGEQPDAVLNGVSGSPGTSVAVPTQLDSEQSIPGAGSTVTDSKSFFRRYFPTFSAAATAISNGVRGLG